MTSLWRLCIKTVTQNCFFQKKIYARTLHTVCWEYDIIIVQQLLKTRFQIYTCNIWICSPHDNLLKTILYMKTSSRTKFMPELYIRHKFMDNNCLKQDFLLIQVIYGRNLFSCDKSLKTTCTYQNCGPKLFLTEKFMPILYVWHNYWTTTF